MQARGSYELPDVISSRCRRASIRERSGGAPLRLRRRDHRERSSRGRVRGLDPGALIGQAGIEQTYNKLLMGTDGASVVTVNSLGREISETPDVTPPSEGRRVQLTIDADIQQAAEDGFQATGYNGSAVMLDPRNGEILSLASLPAFDPNAFAGGIDATTWNVADHRQAAAAAEPRHSGPLLARLDVQDRGRRRRRSRKA